MGPCKLKKTQKQKKSKRNKRSIKTTIPHSNTKSSKSKAIQKAKGSRKGTRNPKTQKRNKAPAPLPKATFQETDVPQKTIKRGKYRKYGGKRKHLTNRRHN